MNEQTARRLNFIINTAYYTVILLLIYLSIRYVVGWILPFLIAFLIVSIVRPIIRSIKKLLHIEREIISFVIMLLIYILICTLLFFLITQLVVWFKGVFADLPDFYKQTLSPAIVSIGKSLSSFLERLPESLQVQLEDFQGELLKSAQNLLVDFSQKGLAALSGFTARIPTFLVALVFTVMLSFFISMQYNKVTAVFRGMLPKKANKLLSDLKVILRKTVLQYLRAVLTLMMITAVELSFGLLVLGKSNAVTIALGIALFDALPFFGTGAIMVPWAALELLQGNYTFGIGVGILYAIVTLIRNIIEPKIVSDRLGLNPIVSLVAIYLGFRTMGVLGMIFMPILVQILFALHQAGSFPLFHPFFPPADVKAADPPEQEP